MSSGIYSFHLIRIQIRNHDYPLSLSLSQYPFLHPLSPSRRKWAVGDERVKSNEKKNVKVGRRGEEKET